MHSSFDEMGDIAYTAVFSSQNVASNFVVSHSAGTALPSTNPKYLPPIWEYGCRGSIDAIVESLFAGVDHSETFFKLCEVPYCLFG
jgi:hypothetical protein